MQKLPTNVSHSDDSYRRERVTIGYVEGGHHWTIGLCIQLQVADVVQVVVAGANASNESRLFIELPLT